MNLLDSVSRSQSHTNKREIDRLILVAASQVEPNILNSLSTDARITLRNIIKSYQRQADSPCADDKMTLFKNLQKNFIAEHNEGNETLITNIFNVIRGISPYQLKSELNRLSLQKWQTANKANHSAKLVFNGFEFASIRHIRERHWPKANMGLATSHFNDDITVEKLRNLAIHAIIYGNTYSSHNRFNHEYCFANPIGVSTCGKKAHVLRVVTSDDGKIITAFPLY